MTMPGAMYVKAIHKRFGYFATWLPNAPIALGDVGYQEGCSFRRVSSLTQLGVSFDTRTSASPIRFQHSWQARISVEDEESAGVGLPGARVSAAICIGFQRSGAFVFQAEGCTLHEIEDKAALAQSIIKVNNRGRWNRRWSVIDAVVHADSATILVANSGKSTVKLASSAVLPQVIDHLARADLDLHISAQQGEVMHFLVQLELVPMFKVSRPRLSQFGRNLTSDRKHVVFEDKSDPNGKGDAVAFAPEFWERLAPVGDVMF